MSRSYDAETLKRVGVERRSKRRHCTDCGEQGHEAGAMECPAPQDQLDARDAHARNY